MLKGKELLGYTVNRMGGDKLRNLYNLANELLDLDEMTTKAISLINPIDQFQFLEDIILGIDGPDDKLIEYLKKCSYPLPRRWGWKQVEITNGEEKIIDKIEWYNDNHKCYCDMFKSAMAYIENTIDCMSNVLVTNIDQCITVSVDSIGVKERFEVYEM